MPAIWRVEKSNHGTMGISINNIQETDNIMNPTILNNLLYFFMLNVLA
jgi:hypothetical protein